MWENKPRCSGCGQEFDLPWLWCPKCGSLILVPPVRGPPVREISLHSMWDFYPFLPHFDRVVSLFEGATPVTALRNIDALRDLNMKAEFRNPTGSFRDRASALLISDALRNKKPLLIAADTGSFCISLAAYAAHAGIHIKNVVPLNLELSKIEQMKIYGSQVLQSGETVEEAIHQAKQMTETEQGYSPTPESNLLTIEGQKTIGLELPLQVRDLEVVIIPRGSGSLFLSVYRGLKDAQASGWIRDLPVLYSVALERAFVDHLAESLEIQVPPLLGKVSQILAETGGKEIPIGANTMLEDAIDLAQREGYFIEPASASVISAAKMLVADKRITPKTSVAILTGSGINALNVFASQLRGTKKVVWGLSTSSTTKFEVLNLIAEKKALHGYAIWVALGKQHTLQSIYQHLTELEQRGMIASEPIEKKKKKYSVTRRGFETLDKMRDLIDYL